MVVRALWKIIPDHIYSADIYSRAAYMVLSSLFFFSSSLFIYLPSLSPFRSQRNASLRVRRITALRSVRSLFYDTINEWLTACRDVTWLRWWPWWLISSSFPFASPRASILRVSRDRPNVFPTREIIRRFIAPVKFIPIERMWIWR